MADDDATMLARQAAGDLLRRMSHRKAFAHVGSQVRLARQFETAIPSASAFGQLLSPDRIVTSWPCPGSRRITLQLPADRRRRSTKRSCNFVLRSTVCMQTVDLNPLLKAELAITTS